MALKNLLNMQCLLMKYIKVARKGGQVAKNARNSYEKATNKSDISNENALKEICK